MIQIYRVSNEIAVENWQQLIKLTKKRSRAQQMEEFRNSMHTVDSIEAIYVE